MNGPRLSITPAGAIFDRSLEPRDLQVLNLLGCYTDKNGWCRRSQVKMAKQIYCGRSSIQRSLDRLVDAGWRMYRYTKQDVLYRPSRIVTDLRRALGLPRCT